MVVSLEAASIVGRLTRSDASSGLVVVDVVQARWRKLGATAERSVGRTDVVDDDSDGLGKPIRSAAVEEDRREDATWEQSHPEEEPMCWAGRESG